MSIPLPGRQNESGWQRNDLPAGDRTNGGFLLTMRARYRVCTVDLHVRNNPTAPLHLFMVTVIPTKSVFPFRLPNFGKNAIRSSPRHPKIDSHDHVTVHKQPAPPLILLELVRARWLGPGVSELVRSLRNPC